MINQKTTKEIAERYVYHPDKLGNQVWVLKEDVVNKLEVVRGFNKKTSIQIHNDLITFIEELSSPLASDTNGSEPIISEGSAAIIKEGLKTEAKLSVANANSVSVGDSNICGVCGSKHGSKHYRLIYCI
jgi:hypothetical protein